MSVCVSVQSHRVVLNSLTSTHWKKASAPHNETLTGSLSYVEPAMTLYEVAGEFMGNAAKCLGKSFESFWTCLSVYVHSLTET